MPDVPMTLYTSLGKTGLRVSRICLGTMTFGDPIAESECRLLVQDALERGINFFDTSNAYEGYARSLGSPGGVGEELLGRCLEGHRHQAVICSKFGNPVGHGPLDAGLSARHLDTELDKSLKRLRTDYIDIVLAHRWDVASRVEEVWNTFDRWVRSGKVRYVGTSNWPVWRMVQAVEKSRDRGTAPVSASSPKYNLLNRGIELDHMACVAEYGIGLLAYQPFQGGVLTGRYRRGQTPAAGSRAAEKPDWIPPMDDALYDRLEALDTLGREAGMTPVEYVTSWILSHPQISSMVVSWRRPDQLRDLLNGSSKLFPAGHVQKIDTLFPPPAPLSGEFVLSFEQNTWKLRGTENGAR